MIEELARAAFEASKKNLGVHLEVRVWDELGSDERQRWREIARAVVDRGARLIK